MQYISTQHPRQFVLLGQGPWLRLSPVSRRGFGVLCLGFVGAMVVLWILLEQQAYPFSPTSHTLVTLLFVAGGLAFVTLLGFVELLRHDRTHQYCPDCLKYMTRGARVCPYCGLREEQAPASSAAPARRPRLSA
jgi:hypothetical protein